MTMPRRRFVRRRAFRRAPRIYEWGSFLYSATVNANTTVSDQVVTADLETDLGGDLIGWRLERVVLNGLVHQNTTANAEATTPYAISMYHRDAAISTAESDGHDSYSNVFFRRGVLYSPAAITAAGHVTGSAMERFSADIRARRIWSSVNQHLRLNVNNLTAVTFSLGFRIGIHYLVSKAR